MSTCTYIYRGDNEDSGREYTYQELGDKLLNSLQALGILYAKTEALQGYEKQATLVTKLTELKKEGLQKYKEGKGMINPADRGGALIEGGADLDVGERDFTVQTLIDSNYYTDRNGKQLMKVYDNEEYIKAQAEELKKQGLSQDEIDAKIAVLKTKGAKIAKDSYDLHKILLKERGIRDNTYTIDDTIKATAGTVFAPLADKIHDSVANKILSEVRKKNGKNSREFGDPSQSRILKNINISAPLIGGKGAEVFAHIDYIAVKPNGALEVFLLKGSHESPSAWDSVKKEKYRNEIALIMQILEANGVRAADVSFNIIPVILRYDDQFNSVTDITVDQAMCYSHSNGGFILTEQLMNARRFIASEESQVQVSDSSIDAVNTQLRALFPDIEVQSKGVQLTAEEYVDANWDYLTAGPQPDSGWKITIGDTQFDVTDPEKGRANKQVVNLVKAFQSQLIDTETGKLSARHIISKITDGRRYGFCELNDSYLNHFFAKYYQHDFIAQDDLDKYKYDWEIISNDTLTSANVILFKNKNTKQVNVVMISPLNLKQKRSFGRNENILGYHISDMRAQDNQGRELLSATNGNIEIMRGLFLLNEILPTLGDDIKLGDIEVVGNLGIGTHGLSYPISLVAPNFTKARQVLTSKDETLTIPNNFQKYEHVSPIDNLIEEYATILKNNPGIGSDFKALRDIIYGTGYSENGLVSSDYDGTIHLAAGLAKDSLSIAKTTEVQIERLSELIEKVSAILKSKAGTSASLSPDALINKARQKIEGGDALEVACSKILISASIALDRLSGNIRISKEDLSTVDSTFSRPQNMEDSQVRIVSKLLQDAIHNVSSKLDPIISDFNVACLDYYRAKGYSKAENFFVGDQSKVFAHLFQQTDNELLFKNPYDMNNDLDSDDRKFLKKALFMINKIRFSGDKNFTFTSENDPGLSNFIGKHPIEYLYVPLEKASQSTRWTHPSKFFEDFKRRTVQYCKNPTLFFQEMYEGIMDSEEREQVTRDMENLQTRNSFRASDVEKGRKRLLGKYGKNFFETNIQNIVIDYVFKELQSQEMNSMLVRTRGILLYLKLTGQRESGDTEKFAKTIDHIDKYLTTSVFGRSIMNEDVQKVVAKIQPLRKMVTAAYIALSPVAACRDTIGGFISNTVRAATKFRTDIDAKDVAYAYRFVMSKGVHSTMDINLLDKMNAKWLVSNINIEAQQEAYKTNTSGITNPGNIAFATLKKPDFLNRMVLLIAKFKHDGSLDAYYVKDGQLKYNWRMDKRFNLLANNDKSNLEAYNKQKALKLSLIIALNNENPGLNIPVRADADIEEGYTNQEIESIKSLGDTIYGSYNASTKAMYENTAIGSQFGVFSTWMNGIYDVYFGKRRESSYQFEQRQAEDENGNLLYIAEDGTITTENTGTPYLRNVPLIVQGVLRTVFKDCLGDIIYNGGKGLKDIWADPMQQMNLRRALTDLLVALLLGALFEYGITPAYKEHKKNDDGTNVIANGIIEILYKGTSSCFDEFKGPAPILEYVSDNTNPAAYQWASRATNDLWKLVSGQESLGGTIIKAQALPRAFQDTYKMYEKATTNGIAEL